MLTNPERPIIVIADDVTGTAEIAGVGLRYGLTSEVQTAFDPTADTQLIVIDSDTRSGSREDAARIVEDIAAQFDSIDPRFIYKKTDSVLRGHVGEEIDAMAGVLKKDRALLLPANPGMGRVIRNGIYYINGIRLHETDFAADPEHPAHTSSVTELLGKTGKFDIRTFPSPAQIPSGALVIGDISSRDNLTEWTSYIDKNCLPAGGSEFFSAILASFGYREQTQPCEYGVYGGPSLFVSGSMSAYSRAMVARAKAHDMPVFSVSRPEDSHTIPTDFTAAIRQRSAMITVDDTISTTVTDARKIPGIIAETTAHILETGAFDNLFITGGATAAAIFHRLGWSRFLVTAELRQGVCHMHTLGQDGCSVIIKPGSYPWPDSLVQQYFGG